MTTLDDLRALGLFEARAPRYTSYPPANHFSSAVTPETTAGWIKAIPSGARVSLYLHIPYCRRLCWFCACRTQGTSTDRPLVPYLAQILSELALVGIKLRPDVVISQIHLGGGTPTLLNPAMLRQLGAALRAFRPLADDLQFSVEIDPTELDQPRIDALREIGMTRASIGVQDFDHEVQEAIGRQQGFELTRDVVGMLRGVGITSLNMDILYGLPYQTNARMADSVAKVLSLNPDRVALYGYAHVPWMAKRQVMIPADALPSPEERLALFDISRQMFLADGYREIGIDHYARATDTLALADDQGRLRRNFQGYTDDTSDVLIGLGASAISRYPQGYAQNETASSRYAAAIAKGSLATERGYEMQGEDQLRAAMIESLMCSFSLDLPAIAARFDLPVDAIRDRTASLRARFASQIADSGDMIRLTQSSRLIARLVAQELDSFQMPQGRHSRAM